jgi:hypothetical protein
MHARQSVLKLDMEFVRMQLPMQSTEVRVAVATWSTHGCHEYAVISHI